MHDPEMPRRKNQPQPTPVQPLTGLLLLARSKMRDGSRNLGRLLDKDAADRIAKQSDQPKALTPEAR